MANFVRFPGSKENDRVTSLKASSDTHSRFHQYCASSSRFPTPPPVSALSAVQRLKKFKAICRKQQRLSSNTSKATNGRLPSRRPLPKTLIIRKGLRKSIALTPGRSPRVKSAKKKITSRKSTKPKSRLLELKEMTKVDSAMCEMYSNLNSGEMDHSVETGNICDLKKKALKKVFSSDEKNTDGAFEARPFDEPLLEYTNQNGSNDSEEIDVVSNSKNEMNGSNGHSLNGNHNGGVGDEEQDFNSNHAPNDHISVSSRSFPNENGETEESQEISNGCDFKGFSDDNLKMNDSENASVEIIFKNSDGYKTENKSEISEEIIPEKSNSQSENRAESDGEDFTFEGILSDSAETEVSSPKKNSAKTSVEKASVAVFDDVSENESQESQEEQSKSIVAVEVEAQNNKSVREKGGDSDASILILTESSAKKKSKTAKASPRKKPISPKKTPSPIKKSPRKKKSPIVTLDMSQFEERSSKHSTVFLVSSASESESINKTVDLVSPESDASTSAVITDSKKTSKVTPVAVSEKSSEDSSKTSPRPRRSKRSFSLTRRPPLRSSERLAKERSSADRSLFESTPQYKRKAETVGEGEEDSAKRLKNETPITRWHFLSSPIKNYWSPKLSNRISYKQPDSTLSPDQFSPVDPSEQGTNETPVQKEETQNASQNSAEKSRSWCTIS